MRKTQNFWLGLVAAAALVSMGCSDSDGGGGSGAMGGSGGAGGTGGVEMAMVRIAHLGTDLPTAENTRVDITVNGTVTVEDLEFAQSTAFLSVPAGDYTVGVNVADSDTEVYNSGPLALAGGSVTTAVAISSVNVESDDEDVLNVLLFDGDLTDLDSTQGRVLVGHGFDSTDFETVDIILPATCDADGALVEDLQFASVRDVADLDEATYSIAIAAPDSCTTAVGPVDAGVTPGVATLLIAAADGTGAVQVYAIVGDFASGDEKTPIPTLPATPQ
jgi:hypothetical protein